VRYLPARRKGASASLGPAPGWDSHECRSSVLLAQYNAATRAYRCICRGFVRVVPDIPADLVLSICIGNSGDQHVRHHHTEWTAPGLPEAPTP